MADTYKVGDVYKIKYDDAPRPPERQYKVGQPFTIRQGEGGLLLATWEVEKTDENGAEGKITRVFKGKAPTDPRKKGGPAANREVKPL